MITISDFTSGLRINSLCQEFIPWSNSKVNACKPFVSFCKENEIGENVRLLNPAAVQTDYLSGKIGVFIAEMVHQVSYLFCPSQAAGRDFFYQGNQLLFFQPLVPLCVNGLHAPQATALTWIPLGASSLASAFVNALTPPFVAE